MFASNTPQNSGSGTNFVQDIKTWWDNCPLFTRFLIFVSAGCCLLNLFSDFPSYIVCNYKAFASFQITRLIFSPFATYMIAELIFAFIAYLPIIAEQEKRNGSLKTIIDFFLKNIEINIVFLILAFSLSIFHYSFGRYEAYSLWGLFMFKIAEQFIDNPEGNASFFGTSLQIPTRYYPLALFVLFSVISNQIRLDMIAGFATGYIHIKYLDAFYQELISDRKITNWENSNAVGYIRTLPGYVSVGSMGGTMAGTLVNAYDSGMVKEAGSPADFNDQEGYNTGFDMHPSGNKFGGNHDVEDLTHDIEKQ